MPQLRLFTSESVTEGHPDKICDQISDSVLDALIAQDPHARVAVETLVTTGLVHVAGEVSTSGYADIPGIVRDRIRRIGYDSSEQSFDGSTCGVTVSIGSQSADIAAGVDFALEAREGGSAERLDQLGAGDQGIMFGFAVRETPELMPLPIHLAHRLSERLVAVRREGLLDYLRPDGKTQVTIGYDGVTPVTVETVVVSTQHAHDVATDTLRADVRRLVVDPVLALSGLDAGHPRVLVNPSGRFETGGPKSDAGLTGRKIIVDTYGAAGLADRLELQVAYAIGTAEPVGLYAETFGTAQVPEERIVAAIRQVFDLRPQAIIDALDLLRPIYAQTAAYGHFGRELPDFTWERLDRVEELQRAAGI